MLSRVIAKNVGDVFFETQCRPRTIIFSELKCVWLTIWRAWWLPVSCTFLARLLIICPIAIAYSMGQIIKSVCVCVCVCVSVCEHSHFRSKIWRYHRVPRPRFPYRCGNFGDSAINKRYIAYFSLRMRETTVFSLLVYNRVPRPRFPKSGENFGDSRTFKADIGVLNICIGFQDFLA